MGFKGVEFKGDVGDFFLAFSVKFKDVPCFLLESSLQHTIAAVFVKQNT